MNVFDRQVVVARNVDAVIAERLHPSSAEPKEPEGDSPALPPEGERGDTVLRVSGSGDADDDIPGLEKLPELTDEDLVVAEIVGQAGEEAHVAVKTDHLERRRSRPHRSGQIIREVHRRGGTPSIAEGED